MKLTTPALSYAADALLTLLTIIVCVTAAIIVYPIALVIAFFTADNPESKQRGPR